MRNFSASVGVLALSSVVRVTAEAVESTQFSVEKNLIRQIENNLKENKAIISKAEKENAMLTLYQIEYHDKMQEFLENNSLNVLNNDPTHSF
jgi:tRNA G18 (ribose-2'-O)-methylase SpoU